MNSSNQLRKKEYWCRICGFLHTDSKEDYFVCNYCNQHKPYLLLPTRTVYYNYGFSMKYVLQCRDCRKEEMNAFNLESACDRKEQVRSYIGDDLVMRDNWKFRAITDRLSNKSHIGIVNERPLVFEWKSRDEQRAAATVTEATTRTNNGKIKQATK
jgi:hypothetical protein